MRSKVLKVVFAILIAAGNCHMCPYREIQYPQHLIPTVVKLKSLKFIVHNITTEAQKPVNNKHIIEVWETENFAKRTTRTRFKLIRNKQKLFNVKLFGKRQNGNIVNIAFSANLNEPSIPK